MFYIERTAKTNNKLYAERSIIDLPKWMNKEFIDLIFEQPMKTGLLIEPEHSIKLTSHVPSLMFDFHNFDYIIWRK